MDKLTFVKNLFEVLRNALLKNDYRCAWKDKKIAIFIGGKNEPGNLMNKIWNESNPYANTFELDRIKELSSTVIPHEVTVKNERATKRIEIKHEIEGRVPEQKDHEFLEIVLETIDYYNDKVMIVIMIS